MSWELSSNPRAIKIIENSPRECELVESKRTAAVAIDTFKSAISFNTLGLSSPWFCFVFLRLSSMNYVEQNNVFDQAPRLKMIRMGCPIQYDLC